jgi:ATP/maltotriose-dependent transcriptional regulator MalT
MHRDLFRPTDFRIGFALMVRAMVLIETQRYAEAAAALTEARELISSRLGDTHPRVAEILQMMSQADLGRGNVQAAAAHGSEALRLYTAAFDSTHSKVAAARSQLGAVRTAQGRYAEAESLLRAAHRVHAASGTPGAAHARIRERLAALYNAWGRPAEAARWRNGPGPADSEAALP